MNALFVKSAAVGTILTMLATAVWPLIPTTSEFFPYAEKLVSLGIIDVRNSASEYRLGDTVTRAEMAKLAVKMAKLDAGACRGTVFADVSDELGDLCSYAETAAGNGVVSRAGAQFRPTDPVTRGEMVKMLVSAAWTFTEDAPAVFSDVPPTSDFFRYVNAAASMGCVISGKSFRPNAPSSRGESFKVAACVAEKGKATGGWSLVWSDEFDGSALNPNSWSFDTGSDGWGNNELQNYTEGANVRVADGMLTIEARKEKSNGADYSSARIKTQGKAFWKFGKIEARIRLPYGKGTWPAFWMLGENIEEVGYPRSGEIDIMEMAGGPVTQDRDRGDSIVSGSLHRPIGNAESDLVSSSAWYENPDGKKFADDFHVFGIEWDASRVRYFVDGNLYQTVELSGSDESFETFRRPFFVILNIAVGGDMPGSPDSSTVWPQKMIVDWVRVYQK